MTQFKVGDKVRVLNVGAIDFGSGSYYDGMETEVVEITRGYPRLKSKQGHAGVVITSDEFHAIEKLTGGDTMNYRTVQRKARVGERILITKASKTQFGKRYYVGDIIDVTGDGGYRSVTCGDYDLILDAEYEVIVGTYGDNADTQEARKRIDALESEIETLRGRVATLEKERTEARMERMSRKGRMRKKTQNQRRADVIAKAKAFVADNVKAVSNGNWSESGIALAKECGPLRIDFVVNAEKRTVVAIPKLANITSHMVSYAKTVAKCAPGDVFNADIGKAIAIGLMFGKDVSEFEQAVQPDEVVDYMTLRGVCGRKVKVTPGLGQTHNYGMLECQADSPYAKASVILDDTEAQY